MNEANPIIVLMYHRIGKSRNAWEARYAISPSNFAAHMHAIAGLGYNAISIDNLLNWLESGITPPKNAILITFDDGFKGVHDYALPVLEHLNWPFTVFLVSDLIGKQDDWTKSCNPDGVTYPLLGQIEIQDMQQRGVAFESHTCTHPSLPGLNDEDLVNQLAGSREKLSELLGREIRYIAYPFGHVDDRVETATRAAGYRAAFSTQPGFNRQHVNPFRIRRLDVHGTDTPAMLLRKIKYGTNDGSMHHVAHYYIDRLINRLVGDK